MSAVGVSTLATSLASSFTTVIPILESSGGCLGFLASSLLPCVFVTLTFFFVTFALVVTMFATVTTGDGTPEIVLMGHCFPIFLVIDRLTVEEWGCTCFRFNLIHLGTHKLHPVFHLKGGICVQKKDAQFPRVST